MLAAGRPIIDPALLAQINGVVPSQLTGADAEAY